MQTTKKIGTNGQWNVSRPVSIQPLRNKKIKNEAIQSLRGIATILVVTHHIIGISVTRGMRVSDDSGWRILDLALVDLRMPLFTAISGYVYAMRPIASLDDMRGLFRAKSRRLLLPLMTVGTLLFGMEFLILGINQKPDPHQVFRLFIFGFEHLWFLQSIFLIFVIVGLLDAGGVLKGT